LMFVSVNAFCGVRYPYHFKKIDERFDSIAERLSQMDFDNRRGEVDAEQTARLEQRARETGNKWLLARAIYWRVRMGQMDANPARCVELLDSARQMLARLPKGSDCQYDAALIDYQLAGNHERLGHYQQCYDLAKSAIDVLEQKKDYYFLGNAQLLLTQLFIDIENSDWAAEQLALCKKSYERAGYPLNRVYFFEAMLSKPEDRIALYKKSAATGKRDWGMTLQAYINISSRFIEMNQPDSAMAYCLQADSLLMREDAGNALFSSLVDVQRVQALYRMGRYNDILQTLDRLTGRGEKVVGERFMAQVYRYYWLAYEKTGNREKAFEYLKRYQKEYERQTTLVKQQEVPKARVREQILRQDDQIRLLEQDAKLSRTWFWFSIALIVILLLAAAVLTVWLYQRARIRRMENAQLRRQLQQEALIYSVNRQNFERDMKQKECEISSSTLLLANKNEVLQQISDITKRYESQGQIPSEYVRQVNDAIGDSLRSDDEWERFKLHFDSVHPDFFLHLKERSSELTENDLRLCAYIRIGMRAKQIAEMLSVSPDSVNSNRYRLRKKFSLSKGESLDDFIRRV